MVPTEPDDRTDFATLLRRIADGDRAAEAQLVALYEPKLRIVARVLLGTALQPYLESADLAQSVHKSLLLGVRSAKFHFDEPGQLVGLALTMLRRKAARHWRHLQRQQRLSGHGQASDCTADVLAQLSQPNSDPARQAQFRDQLQTLVAGLDPPEQRILSLRLEGLTPAEIADQIGVGRVALRMRLTRLRQKLHAAGALTDWI